MQFTSRAQSASLVLIQSLLLTWSPLTEAVFLSLASLAREKKNISYLTLYVGGAIALSKISLGEICVSSGKSATSEPGVPCIKRLRSSTSLVK